MWQVKPTVWIVIGAQRIDCGVMVGTDWQQGSMQSIAYAPQWDDMLVALQQIGAPLLGALSQGMPPLEVDAIAARGKKASVLAHIKVLISEAWLPTVSVPWSPACLNAVTAQAYVQAQLRQAGFEISAGDEIRLDDAPYGQPRVVVAYPAILLEALSSLAQQMKSRLAAVLPLSLAAWCYAQKFLQEPASFAEPSQTVVVSSTDKVNRKKPIGMGAEATSLAVIEAQQVTFVQMMGTQLLQLLSRSLPHPSHESTEIPDAESAVLAHWQRIQLRNGPMVTPPHLHVLDLNHAITSGKEIATSLKHVALPVEANAAHRPQTLQLVHALGATAVTTIWQHPLAAWGRVQQLSGVWRRYLLAGLSLLVMAGMIFYAWHLIRAVEMEQHVSADTSPRPPEIRQPPLGREEKNRIVSVNAAIRQMNLPVAALLQAMQPPRDIRVALLGVDLAAQGSTGTAEAATLGPRTATLKITAEARTGAEMASYVAYLAERRPFVGAYLVRHEVMETQAEQPYRFTVEALWLE